jgi:hypothetical protein
MQCPEQKKKIELNLNLQYQLVVVRFISWKLREDFLILSSKILGAFNVENSGI